MSEGSGETRITPTPGSRRIVRCPHCKKAIDATRGRPGQEVVCPACRRKFTLPAASAVAAGAPTATLPPSRPAAATGGAPLPPEANSAATPGPEATRVPTHQDVGTGPSDRTLAVAEERQLGAYRVVGFLGKGGMGQVYKGFDTSLHRHVAIKELAPALAANGELVERFLREARLVAKLNHENICDIYFMGRASDTGVPFFAMEFVDGRSLEDRLKAEGKLPVDEAVSIVRQVSLALRAAHGKGMIHRDIKPANVMLTSDGVVKVTDFGLAKLVEGGQSLTRTDVIMGTPHYMSPEAGQGLPCDLRTDVYSLGVTFFHVLAGRVPFDGPSAPSVLHKQINEELPDLSALREDVPDHVVSVIRRMTMKRVEDRYQDYDALLADLDSLSEGKRPEGGVDGFRLPSISGEQVKVAAQVAGNGGADRGDSGGATSGAAHRPEASVEGEARRRSARPAGRLALRLRSLRHGARPGGHLRGGGAESPAQGRAGRLLDRSHRGDPGPLCRGLRPRGARRRRRVPAPGGELGERGGRLSRRHGTRPSHGRAVAGRRPGSAGRALPLGDGRGGQGRGEPRWPGHGRSRAGGKPRNGHESLRLPRHGGKPSRVHPGRHGRAQQEGRRGEGHRGRELRQASRRRSLRRPTVELPKRELLRQRRGLPLRPRGGALPHPARGGGRSSSWAFSSWPSSSSSDPHPRRASPSSCRRFVARPSRHARGGAIGAPPLARHRAHSKTRKWTRRLRA